MKQTSGNVAFAGDFYDESVQYGDASVERNRDGTVAWPANEDFNIRRFDEESPDDESLEEALRKRVRVRVPVVRGRSARQHKLTVVRRRPLTSRTEALTYSTATHAPRRIVVTRVRTFGSDRSIYPTDVTTDPTSYQTTTGKHKVTITRRRKLLTTPTTNKVRVTRKKLVAVRPILPTPTFTIITTGFFTASSFEYDEYSDEEDEKDDEGDKERDRSAVTPSLEVTPNLIDSKPDEETSFALTDASSVVSQDSTSNTPVIITDHFFLPPSDDEEEYDYDDETTTENVEKITIPTKDEDVATTEAISTKEDNIVSTKSDSETQTESDDFMTTTPISRSTSEEEAKTDKIHDNTTINVTESVDINVQDINNTSTEKSTTENLLDENVTTTEFTSVEENNTDKSIIKDHTTVADELDESTESPNLSEEKITTISTATKEDISPVTEITLGAKDKEEEEKTEAPEDSTERSVQSTPETIKQTAEEILPVQPEIKIASNSTQISPVETVPLFSVTIAPSFESVIPLETAKSSMRDRDTSRTDYLDDSYIPSVIPLGANYSHEVVKSSITAGTAVSETTPVKKVTTKIASPTPEEIEAGLADDLYLSLSRLDFPEILPSKPAIKSELETKSTPDLALEPSTSVYYTETVVTSTRLRTYTYVVTQLNGLETKVTSSTTVRPRVTTLTLTVPVTVTVTPTVESSANVISSVYNPVSVIGE